MRRIVPIDSVQQIGMLADGLVPTLAAEKFNSHAPDLHLAAMQHGVIAGRLSLWWKHGPTLAGEKVGAVGHYAVADQEAGAQLLQEAIRILSCKGLQRVVAPMDGSLWRRHRYVTQSSGRPPFFLEPQNPPEYPQHFQQAGFEPFLNWSSMEGAIPNCEVAGASQQRLAHVKVRPINLSVLDEELEAMHGLLTREARHAPLHSALSKHAFLAKHRRARGITVPELTLMAESEGKLVGFVFAVPDLLQAEHKQAIDTLVVSNLVAASGRASAGVGRLLLCELYQRARQRGLTKVIHALVPQSQPRRLEGQIIRQYTLFARSLP